MTISRRRFLQRGARLGAGAFLLGGCAGPVRRDPNAAFLELPLSADSGRVALGRYPQGAWRKACEETIAQVSDMSWLSKGDRVFLKLAANSPYEHPAVTAPQAVRAVTEFLLERGAGDVVVGDQAGVEHVRLTQSARESSTREALKESGLLAAIESCGARLHCFDDQGWDGYFQPEADFATAWNEAPFLPRILQEVDHVINLPRLGAHALAGYTCAVKIAVGWLRDDSRLELHQKAKTFFQKTAEISHFAPLRDKLRLSLTLGDQALLNIGPDMGSTVDLDGVVALASTSLVDHDLLASAVLLWLDRNDTSFYDLYAPYPEDADHWNRFLVETAWGEQALERYSPLRPYELEKGLAHDHCLSHLARLQGYRPQHVEVLCSGELPAELLTYLRGYGAGTFALA